MLIQPSQIAVFVKTETRNKLVQPYTILVSIYHHRFSLSCLFIYLFHCFSSLLIFSHSTLQQGQWATFLSSYHKFFERAYSGIQNIRCRDHDLRSSYCLNIIYFSFVAISVVDSYQDLLFRKQWLESFNRASESQKAIHKRQYGQVYFPLTYCEYLTSRNVFCYFREVSPGKCSKNIDK